MPDYKMRIVVEAVSKNKKELDDTKKSLDGISEGGSGAGTSLGNLKAKLKDVGVAFASVLAAGYAIGKMFDATGGEFVRYASQVRNLSNAFGIDEEAASRLIQVTDDLKISQDSLTMALKVMAGNGIQPSLAGLQSLADKYNAIQDPAAQAKFLVDNFGRGGLNMAAAMRMGSAGLEQMNAGIEQNLILTRQGVDAARAYEITTDQLSDSWKAFRMQIGQQGVPALNNLLLTQIAAANVQRAAREEGHALMQGTREYNEAVQIEVEALKAAQDAQVQMTHAQAENMDTTQAQIELERQQVEATKELEAQKRILAIALQGPLKQAYDTYAQGLEPLQAEHEQLLQELIKLRNQGYGPTSQAVQDITAKLKANESAQAGVNGQMQKSIALMIYQQTAASLDAAGQLKLARSLGLISEADYAVAVATQALTDKYDENGDGIVDATENQQEYIQQLEYLNNLIAGLPPLTVIEVVTNYTENGSPPTTGTGASTGGTGTTAPPPGGGGGPLCFPAGTLVRTPHGLREIETLEVGDEVYSFDFDAHEQITARVAKTFAHAAEDCTSLILINEEVLATPEHPFHTERGWVNAGDLQIGDRVTVLGGGSMRVYAWESGPGGVPTYNIETDHESHNYFANGYVVHNKNARGVEDFVVPPGYNNDSYRMWVESGEHVTVTPTGATNASAQAQASQSGGGHSFQIGTLIVDGQTDIGEFVQTVMQTAGLPT